MIRFLSQAKNRIYLLSQLPLAPWGFRLALSRTLTLVLLAGTSLTSQAVPPGAPDPNAGSGSTGREFIASCTYGVLAGTLVGAASLAFTDRPGDNLNHVARGASLGLYTGILLGLYVVYIVPGLDDVPDEDPVVKLDRRMDRVPLTLAPTLGRLDQPDGASFNWVYRF